MQIIIARTTKHSSLRAALLTHFVFKTRIYAMVSNESFDPEMINLIKDYTGSRTGKWFLSQKAQREFKNLDCWKSLETALRKVHEHASNALKAKHFNEGQSVIGQQLDQMELMSKNLVKLILELNELTKQDMSIDTPEEDESSVLF